MTSVMTAMPYYADSYERHQCHSAAAQIPKYDAHSMHARHTQQSSCHSRTHREMHQDDRYAPSTSTTTPSWEQRAQHHVPPPSLVGSMRLENSTATTTWGLNGTFAGSRTSARPAAPAQESSGSAWRQTRERHVSSPREEESSDSESNPSQSVAPMSRRGSRAGILPEIPNRAPALSESDIILGTSSNSRRSPLATTSERENARLPPIRSRAAMDEQHRDSPYDPACPPAKRACVQLPPFQELIKRSTPLLSLASPPWSRASFTASSYSGRTSTVSPPPSPSPSVASFSADAHSSGQSVTDTDPTEDEDVMMDKQHQHERYTADRTFEARPSAPLDDVAHASTAVLQPFKTNTFVHVAPQPPADASQGRRGKRQNVDAEDEVKKPRRRGEQKTPPQKKYRFVASRLSGDVSSPPETGSSDGDERGRPDAVAANGAKRKYTHSPSPALSSSPDIPLPTAATAQISRVPAKSPVASSGSPPQSQPQPQPQGQARTPVDPPKRRGRPPRPAYDIESVAPIDPDSPEGQGQFPVYCWQGEEQPMACQFPACGALLTGKKSDATSHLKEHFADVGGRMLVCPWDAVNEHGVRAPCGKKFKDSANMGRHVATKHLLSEKYECGKCHRAFARRDAALRHMKTMCSPEKELRRAARRMAEKDVESEDENDADKSGTSSSREE
ncbi:hypothetical protein C2E23DRAFT_813982 [Lenzites betulinus]|nr:hypothetical protein C2E23DRAFT_813982 [Lenzites betulinus]